MACKRATPMPMAIHPMTNQGKIRPAPWGIKIILQITSSGAIRSQVVTACGHRCRSNRRAVRITSQPINKMPSCPAGDVQNVMLIPPLLPYRPSIIKISNATCNALREFHGLRNALEGCNSLMTTVNCLGRIARKEVAKLSMEKKKKSTFQKITNVFVWIMIIATLGSLIFGAIFSLM